MSLYYSIVNDPAEEYFIVGDVHGSLDQLEVNYREYYEKRLKNSKLKLIFIGDYLDRGSNVGIIDKLQMMSESTFSNDIVFICGNHEIFKYANTLSDTYDPTSYYKSRLQFYHDYGIKLCYAYVNLAKKLIITHAGINLNRLGKCNMLDIKQFCDNTVNKLNSLTSFYINGACSLTLTYSDTIIHDTSFYSLVDSYEDVSPTAISKHIDNSDWVQIFGHYHSTFILSRTNQIYSIEMAQFAEHNLIKYICIDASDNNSISTRLELDAKNNYKWIVKQ